MLIWASGRLEVVGDDIYFGAEQMGPEATIRPRFMAIAHTVFRAVHLGSGVWP